MHFAVCYVPTRFQSVPTASCAMLCIFFDLHIVHCSFMIVCIAFTLLDAQRQCIYDSELNLVFLLSEINQQARSTVETTKPRFSRESVMLLLLFLLSRRLHGGLRLVVGVKGKRINGNHVVESGAVQILLEQLFVHFHSAIDVFQELPGQTIF